MSEKIIITGGTGMIGKSILDLVNNENNLMKEKEWIFLSSKDCDLTDLQQVDNLFSKLKPTLIIHLAANVGGLFKNLELKTEMFKDNVRINENVLEMSHKHNIQKGIFCLSSCIFPQNPSKFPMDESILHESEPHSSNKSYAYSKRMLELQCQNYNNQFGRQYICLIPVNLYGPYDNFNLNDSHVIPGILHRLYLAKKNQTNFTVYGTGKPLRQFLFSYDFAKIIIWTLFNYQDTKSIICANEEVSITEVTKIIFQLFNYNLDNLEYDTLKSDGIYKKTVSNSYFKSIYPDFEFTKLEEGLKQTVTWFNQNFDTCRK